MSFGQGYSNLGNTSPSDTARINVNYFLFNKSYRTPFYASAVDSNFHLTIPGGLNVKYSIQQFISRIATVIGIPTFQTVLNAGSTLNKNNDVDLGGYQFRTYNGTWKSDNAQIGTLLLDGQATFSVNLAPFDSLDVPNMDAVEDYVNESSFDYNVSTTITSLTDSRFARQVSFIIYRGLTYNSTYFTQAGTMITFLNDLKFYNGQKLTFYLK
jgi:hypothetical protein